jgi:hypothetical protein
MVGGRFNARLGREGGSLILESGRCKNLFRIISDWLHIAVSYLYGERIRFC